MAYEGLVKACEVLGAVIGGQEQQMKELEDTVTRQACELREVLDHADAYRAEKLSLELTVRDLRSQLQSALEKALAQSKLEGPAAVAAAYFAGEEVVDQDGDVVKNVEGSCKYLDGSVWRSSGRYAPDFLRSSLKV